MESKQSTEQTRQAYWDHYINYWLERVADSNTTKENADRMPDDRIMERYIKLLVDSMISNSSLGMQCESVEEFARGTDSKSANLSQIPQSSHSHTANTRIVCGEILDSKAYSESPSPVIASQALQSTDSKNMDCHAGLAPARNDKSLESPADSKPTSTAGLKQTKPQGEVSCDDFRGCAGTSKGDKAQSLSPKRVANSSKSAQETSRFLAGGGQYQILDYGCGFGRAYPYFENLNCAYHGCDIAQSCIDHTLSAHPRATARKLLEDDRIDFPSEYFDGVFCYGVFDACYQHITLLEILRVLKVGGIALITGKNDHYLESDEPALIAEVGARKNKHPNYFTNTPLLLDELKKRNIAILHTRFFKERKDGAQDCYEEQMPSQFYTYTLLIQKCKDSILTPFEPFSHAYSQTFLSKNKSL